MEKFENHSENIDPDQLGHDKPLLISAERLQEMGQVLGYLRIVFFESGPVMDGKFIPPLLSSGLAKIMAQQPEICKCIENATQLCDGLKNLRAVFEPLTNQMYDSANPDTECQCQKCRAKRKKEAGKNSAQMPEC